MQQLSVPVGCQQICLGDRDYPRTIFMYELLATWYCVCFSLFLAADRQCTRSVSRPSIMLTGTLVDPLAAHRLRNETNYNAEASSIHNYQ